MILVAVDTSTRWAGVGVEIDSGERTEIVWRSDQNHGKELMNNITLALGRFELRATEITHLAVALGPGGFSAVRVGISAALGLATPRNLPITGIATHQVEAFPYLEQASPGSPLLSLIPAGRGELSWARFESSSGKISETGLSSEAELAGSLSASTLLCGEGAASLRGKVPGERILAGNGPTRSPASLLTLARQRFDGGQSTPLAELRPIYARPPSISRPNPPK